jgi:hypothetical protein
VDAGRSAMISAEKSHIENFTEKKIKKINAKTEQGLKKTVLKWTKFNVKDQRTHPTNGQEILTHSFDGYNAICNFEKTLKSFVDIGNGHCLNKVYAWMPVPTPHFVADSGVVFLDKNLNDEYLIEQTTLETFDIIDAITPALREAVKHLLVQQGANK